MENKKIKILIQKTALGLRVTSHRNSKVIDTIISAMGFDSVDEAVAHYQKLNPTATVYAR